MFKSRRKKPKTMRTVLAREMHLSRRKVNVGTRLVKPITEKMMGEFLVADMTDKAPYIKNVYECDSFALTLVGNAKRWFAEHYNINPAVGIVWEDRDPEPHAFVFYLIPTYKVRYTDPQLDRQIFPTGEKIFALV